MFDKRDKLIESLTSGPYDVLLTFCFKIHSSSNRLIFKQWTILLVERTSTESLQFLFIATILKKNKIKFNNINIKKELQMKCCINVSP